MKGRVGTAALTVLLMGLAGPGTVLAETDLKADALSAAWPGMQEGAKVVD